jgi:hypothetical protein
MNAKYPINVSFALAMSVILLISGIPAISAPGNGNPKPGFPKDTIVIHIQPMTGNTNNCNGGNSLHIGAYISQGRVISIPPTNLSITMVDWRQIDNDKDGLLDEDPIDGVDNDLDGKVDEDPKEKGSETRAIDCDSRDGDGKVSIQIRDTDPRRGWISTQTWFSRLVGIPQQNFAFKSVGEHTVNCTSVDIGVDGIYGTLDDTYVCDSEQIEIGSIDLSTTDAFKKAGGGKKAGGKTNFVDITDLFLVDVDTNGDLNNDGDQFNDLGDLQDVSIFSVSCEDNPETPVNETLDVCPLGSIIWDIDEGNTNRPTVQIFVIHDGNTQIVGGKKIR